MTKKSTFKGVKEFNTNEDEAMTVSTTTTGNFTQIYFNPPASWSYRDSFDNPDPFILSKEEDEALTKVAKHTLKQMEALGFFDNEDI